MSEESYELVRYEVADGVATVTLNNPEKRNMLSAQMLAELVDAMKRAQAAGEVKAVVLTGAGEKAFCAGADLGGFAADVPLIEKHFASDLFLARVYLAAHWLTDVVAGWIFGITWALLWVWLITRVRIRR